MRSISILDLEYSPIAGVTFDEGRLHAFGLTGEMLLEPAQCAILELLTRYKSVATSLRKYNDFALGAAQTPFDVARVSDRVGIKIEALFADRRCLTRLVLRADKERSLQAPRLMVTDQIPPPPTGVLSEWCESKFVRVAFANNVLGWGEVLRDVAGDANRLAPRHFMELGGFVVPAHYGVTSECSVTQWLTATIDGARLFPVMEEGELAHLLSQLVQNGLVTAPIGSIDWGHFAFGVPLCPFYGYTRGTPLDRHYLKSFSQRMNPIIRGRVLEVGGSTTSALQHGFDCYSTYTVVDVQSSPSVHVVGDVHDGQLFQAESFDAIVAFNVLEHCRSPSQVVANFRRWLCASGKVIVATPNTQRIHRDPADFWRIQPDAYQEMFGMYKSVEITVYGSLITSIAALCGAAAEEIPSDLLEKKDERYPVLTCVMATA